MDHWGKGFLASATRTCELRLNIFSCKSNLNWLQSTPVEPFGGAEDFDISDTHVVYTTKDPQYVVILFDCCEGIECPPELARRPIRAKTSI